MTRSPLFTAEEACRYLRLDVGRGEDGDPVRALQRYVVKGLLHPTKIGRFNRYSIDELDHFIRSRTEPHDDA